MPFFLRGLRNPFFPAAGCHTYLCAAVGTIHGGSRFALLSLDARCYRVKEGDVIEGHTIISIGDDGVVLRDAKGLELGILTKKGPST